MARDEFVYDYLANPPQAEPEAGDRHGSLLGAVVAAVTPTRSSRTTTADQWRVGSVVILAAIFGAWMLWGWWR